MDRRAGILDDGVAELAASGPAVLDARLVGGGLDRAARARGGNRAEREAGVRQGEQAVQVDAQRVDPVGAARPRPAAVLRADELLDGRRGRPRPRSATTGQTTSSRRSPRNSSRYTGPRAWRSMSSVSERRPARMAARARSSAVLTPHVVPSPPPVPVAAFTTNGPGSRARNSSARAGSWRGKSRCTGTGTRARSRSWCTVRLSIARRSATASSSATVCSNTRVRCRTVPDLEDAAGQLLERRSAPNAAAASLQIRR